MGVGPGVPMWLHSSVRPWLGRLWRVKGDLDQFKGGDRIQVITGGN